MDEMQKKKKITFCVFMSHERRKPFLGIFVFVMGDSPSNFAIVSFLLTSLRKDYLLRRRLGRYRSRFNGGISSVVGS